MAPTRVVRRTKRAFRREERAFRRRIIRKIERRMIWPLRCEVCGVRGGSKIIWINVPKYDDVYILVLKWYRKCWRCGKETPVLWAEYVYYDKKKLKIAYSSFLKETVYKRLERLYFDFFGRCYSSSLGKEVYGNQCVYCGAYQGNGYVSNECCRILKYHPERIVERRKYSCRLTLDEAIMRGNYVIKMRGDFVLHHLSYNPEKIICVCRRCHALIHLTDKYPHLKPSQKRPKSRKKKEKEGEGGEKRKTEVKKSQNFPFRFTEVWRERSAVFLCQLRIEAE